MIYWTWDRLQRQHHLWNDDRELGRVDTSPKEVYPSVYTCRIFIKGEHIRKVGRIADAKRYVERRCGVTTSGPSPRQAKILQNLAKGTDSSNSLDPRPLTACGVKGWIKMSANGWILTAAGVEVLRRKRHGSKT